MGRSGRKWSENYVPVQCHPWGCQDQMYLLWMRLALIWKVNWMCMQQITPNPGEPIVRRLNRTEYGNAVRDLLAVEF